VRPSSRYSRPAILTIHSSGTIIVPIIVRLTQALGPMKVVVLAALFALLSPATVAQTTSVEIRSGECGTISPSPLGKIRSEWTQDGSALIRTWAIDGRTQSLVPNQASIRLGPGKSIELTYYYRKTSLPATICDTTALVQFRVSGLKKAKYKWTVRAAELTL